MGIKAKSNISQKLANFFGGLGYFFCLLQWFWAIVLYFSIIEKLAVLFSANNDKQVYKPLVIIDTGINMPLMIVSAIIAIFMLLVTVYIIYKIPITIAKTSEKIVHSTAENITPIVLHAQHKKDTKSNHKKISIRLVIFIKIILIIIPVILSFTSQYIDSKQIDFDIAVYVSLWLACFSILSFATQYIFANLLSVKKQDLW